MEEVKTPDRPRQRRKVVSPCECIPPELWQEFRLMMGRVFSGQEVDEALVAELQRKIAACKETPAASVEPV